MRPRLLAVLSALLCWAPVPNAWGKLPLAKPGSRLPWALFQALKQAAPKTPEHGPKRPAKPQERAAIRALIARLNAPAVEDREKAQQKLRSFGQRALPQLKRAAKSKDPETAARAKRLVRMLSAGQRLPGISYAQALPARALLFAEISDAKSFSARWRKTPLGKMWRSPAAQKWWRAYRKKQAEDEALQTFQALARIQPKLDGRVAGFIGPPEQIDEKDLNPPALFVLESRSTRIAFQAAVRNWWNAEGDAPESRHARGPFTILEHLVSYSVFNGPAYFYGLSPSAMEHFLDGLVRPPKKSLAPAIQEARGLQPRPDALLCLARDGLERLVEAGFDMGGFTLEEEHVAALDALGFGKGSVLLGALKLNPKGFQETFKVKQADPRGLLTLLAHLPAPPAPPAGQAEALDLLPPHAALWISLRGDLSARAQPLAKALRALDQLPDGVPTKKKPAPHGKPKPKPKAKPAAVSRLEALEADGGVPLEKFLAHVRGPVEIALFVKQVGKDFPLQLPMACLVSTLIKTPAAVRGALDHATQGKLARLGVEEWAGGRFYFFKGDETRPGWWLKGSRLAFASERAVLSLALAALDHKAGNERLADRPDVKRVRAGKAFSNSKQGLTAFADAGQLLRMPYGLSRLLFAEDHPEDPWPAYPLLKPELEQVALTCGPGKQAGEVLIRAQTPTSLFGLLYLLYAPPREIF